MSITAELRASARATYRLLFRTAASTFKGDDRVLNAFREKVRTDFREGREITDVDAYAARIQLGRDVADVLRKNIVQGVKVDASRAAAEPVTNTVGTEGGVWRLKLTKDTELGSNESLKSPQNPNRVEGRQGCCQSSASTSPIPSSPSSELRAEADQATLLVRESNDSDGLENEGEESESTESIVQDGQSIPRKLNFPTLKRLSQTRVKPTLNEDDLEESFVRGSGPGGQSINKTANNVQLLHKPTGIRVSCQETRSLQTNRMIARKNLLEKLDQIANPGLSKENLKRAKEVERERRRRRKARKKAKSKTCGEYLVINQEHRALDR